MPIYEYFCSQCASKQEIIHKVSEPAPLVCPNCQAQGTLKKAVTTGSFHLKGGGWYKDLYASPKKEAAENQKPEAKTEPKAEPKAEPKEPSGASEPKKPKKEE